mmetsp:Transcript_14379/g.39772  ORF Transcript_14379/g.39772 Transcript_14379/m.39772 type:complete len:233 (-) Transcript_14379:513-1211(-)
MDLLPPLRLLHPPAACSVPADVPVPRPVREDLARPVRKHTHCLDDAGRLLRLLLVVRGARNAAPHQWGLRHLLRQPGRAQVVLHARVLVPRHPLLGDRARQPAAVHAEHQGIQGVFGAPVGGQARPPRERGAPGLRDGAVRQRALLQQGELRCCGLWWLDLPDLRLGLRAEEPARLDRHHPGLGHRPARQVRRARAVDVAPRGHVGDHHRRCSHHHLPGRLSRGPQVEVRRG